MFLCVCVDSCSLFLSGCEQMPNRPAVGCLVLFSFCFYVIVQSVYTPHAAVDQKRPSLGSDRRRLCGSALIRAPSLPVLDRSPRTGLASAADQLERRLEEQSVGTSSWNRQQDWLLLGQVGDGEIQVNLWVVQKYFQNSANIKTYKQSGNWCACIRLKKCI